MVNQFWRIARERTDPGYAESRDQRRGVRRRRDRLPAIAPDHEAPKADTPKVEAIKPEASRIACARHRGQDADHVAQRPRLAQRRRRKGRGRTRAGQAPLRRDGRGGGAGNDCRRGRRRVRDHGDDAHGRRGCDRAGKRYAGSRDRTDRCRGRRIEERPRSHLQDGADASSTRPPIVWTASRRRRPSRVPSSQNSPRRSRSSAPRPLPSSLRPHLPLSRRPRRTSRAR